MNVLLILFNEPSERLNSAVAPLFSSWPGILLGNPGPPTTFRGLSFIPSWRNGEQDGWLAG